MGAFNFSPQIITTADGSHTLYIPELNEHYHSVHGAITESKHVFIRHGLQYAFENNSGGNPIHIFEMGFGTGLNACLTAVESRRAQQIIRYTAIESNPLSPELISGVNYPSLFSEAIFEKDFLQIHKCGWNAEEKISDQFTIKKIKNRLEEYFPGENYHLVYYDAFAPRVQPELWTKEIFEKIYSWLFAGGILVTYCAKGAVKRNLNATGFHVDTLPGPPGKREMLRAIKVA